MTCRLGLALELIDFFSELGLVLGLVHQELGLELGLAKIFLLNSDSYLDS